MTSATAHPVDALALRDALDAPTHLAAVRAAVRNTVAPNVVRDRQTVVRKALGRTNRTELRVEDHRDPLKTRTT